MKRALVLALAAALCLPALAAQQKAEPPKPARVFLTVRGEDQGAVADAYASLGASLASSPLVLAVFAPLPAEDAGKQSAQAALCKLFIDVRLGSSEEGATAAWTVASRADGNALARGEATRTSTGPAWSDSSFWQPLMGGVSAALAAIPEEKVLVLGKPGTEVTGIGADFSIPESGEIEVPLELPALVSWSATAGGSYPAKGSVYVQEGGTSIEIPDIPLPKPTRWAIDASLNNFAFPELRLSYAPSPSWFLKATITQFAFGLSLQNGYSKSYPPLVYSTTLVEPGLGAGWYPLRGSAGFKPYLALDFFLRLAFPEWSGFFIDPVAPLGLTPIVGLEWSRLRRFGAFFEFGAIVYPVADEALMYAYLGNSNGGRLLFGGGGLFPGHPGWFGEFPFARIGLRYKL